MKSNLLVLPFVLLLFSTCKKERHCECITSSSYTSSSGRVFVMSGGASVSTTTYNTTYKKVTKADMKTWCGNSTYLSEQVYPDGSGSTDTLTSMNESVCKLK